MGIATILEPSPDVPSAPAERSRRARAAGALLVTAAIGVYVLPGALLPRIIHAPPFVSPELISSLNHPAEFDSVLFLFHWAFMGIGAVLGFTLGAGMFILGHEAGMRRLFACNWAVLTLFGVLIGHRLSPSGPHGSSLGAVTLTLVDERGAAVPGLSLDHGDSFYTVPARSDTDGRCVISHFRGSGEPIKPTLKGWLRARIWLEPGAALVTPSGSLTPAFAFRLVIRGRSLVPEVLVEETGERFSCPDGRLVIRKGVGPLPGTVKLRAGKDGPRPRTLGSP